MKKFHSLIVLLVPMMMSFQSDAAAEVLGDKLSPCGGCHGLPPLDTPESENFFAGAHPVHEKLECSQCHNSSSTSDHNNGVIELRPELNYDHGSQIPYPGGGGGSCGGDKNFPMPNECHSGKEDFKCYWIPGRVCKPNSLP